MMAVRAAVIAATITFKISSRILVFFISLNLIGLRSLKKPPLTPSLKGATGVFRVATICGCGPTKGSDYPVATGEDKSLPLREILRV